MDADHWEKMKLIFREALQRDPSDRSAYLEEACRDTPSIRNELISLLDSDTTSGDFLETPASIEKGDCWDEDPLKGTRISHYLIERVINSGGMGTVYAAQQDKPERTVAVKVMRRGIASASALRRFEYEAQFLARLTHPNIAQVFEAGTRDEMPYFVMEYVPKARSIDRYSAGENLSIRQRLALFMQVCEAVHHGHQRGIIHRDLKPSNLLVDEQGNVKVIDFGVARATDADVAMTTAHTEVGQLIGTLQYMSPEQCKADPHDLDVRSDVYSLGVVLYELLCGSLPYDVRKTPVFEATRMIHEVVPRRPSTVNRILRGDVETILLKALEKERADRYYTVADLNTDIQRYLNGEVILAKPAGPALRIWKRARRNPVSSVTLLCLVLLLVVGPWFFAQREYENRIATEDAKREVERQREIAEAEKKRAVAAEAEAVMRYEEITRLSDVKRLSQLLEEEATLWPALPERCPELESWISRAEKLLHRLPAHRITLEALRKTARFEEKAWQFNNVEEQWQHDTLDELVAGLESLDSKEGTLEKVRQRFQWAQIVHDESITKYELDWDNAINAIADEESCPIYAGLELEPMVGFVPLGKNPETGLFEFAHLESGEIPDQTSDGKIRMTETSGMVFVLVPGGSFVMGSMLPSDEHPLGSPNVDPHSLPSELPVHTVTINPFLLSKYEMTQGQWLRFTGMNPSNYSPEWTKRTYSHSLLHPVEKVTWFDCKRVLSRLNLRLPTESEWEYAARAGTTTVWWTGDIETSLSEPLAANIADYFCKNNGGPQGQDWPFEEWLNDGYVLHAPVGSFRPNPFGLHDVCGNVFEWCQDTGTTDYNYAPNDGSALEWWDQPIRSMRGGCWGSDTSFCRSAARNGGPPESQSSFLGVRPACSLPSD